MQLFERNNVVPSSKMMTFFRNETFTLQAKYQSELLSPGADLNIGQFDIGPIPPPTNPEETKQKLKVKVRLNLDGRDAQPALVIGRHYITERDGAPVQYNDIV